MRPVPYTTKSGLQIGCRYEPPAPIYPMSMDAERLQRALIDPAPRLTLADGILWTLSVVALSITFSIAMII